MTAVAVVALTLYLFVAAGGAPADLTPKTGSTGEGGGLEACVKTGVDNMHSEEAYELNAEETPAFPELTKAARTQGRSAFVNWYGDRDEAFPDAVQVDFLFERDAEAAEATVQGVRDEKVRERDWDEDPLVAERYGNLVMFYEEGMTPAQRARLDDCLQQVGVKASEDAAKPVLTAEENARFRREYEAKEKREENADRAEARRPERVGEVFIAYAEACIDKTSNVQLETVDASDPDPQWVAPKTTAAAKAVKGTPLGERWDPTPGTRSYQLGTPRLPAGWDWIYLPTEDDARALETDAAAEVKTNWPGGSVARDGQVLVLYANRDAAASHKKIENCTAKGLAAVQAHLREYQPLP